MGCQQSNQQIYEVNFRLPIDYFNEVVVCKKLRSSTRLSEIIKELKAYDLHDKYSPNKISLKIVYNKKVYKSTQNLTLEGIYYNDKDELNIICKEYRVEKILIRFQSCQASMKSTALQISKNATVRSIKEKLRHKKLINTSKFHLVWYDLDLEDEKSLDFYNIGADEVLMIILNLKNIPQRTSQQALPQTWKVKNSGLIFEGICQSDRCTAYKQRVSVVVGYGDFNMNLELVELHKYVCPVCSTPLNKVKQFGFANCSFKCYGVLNDGSIKCIEDTKTTYEEFMKAEKVEWRELFVSVKPREDSSTPGSTHDSGTSTFSSRTFDSYYEEEKSSFRCF